MADETKPTRVLMLSHGCQSRTEGQPKAILLGKNLDIVLRVLTPKWWKDYGRWRTPEEPVEKTFELRPARVRFAWLGPVQSYMHYYPDLAAEVAAFRPDVINVWEEPWSLVCAHACAVRAKVLPSAAVVCETEQNIFKPLPPPFRQIRRYVLGRVDAMVGRSNEAIEVLRRLGYTGPAELVPNAVDTELFRPMDRGACRAALNREAGVDWGDRFVVGFVGRIVIEKGIMDLLEAIGRCRAAVVLVVIGSGAAEAEVRRSVAGMGIGDRVVLIPARPLDQLPVMFGAMDVLAVPSRTTPRWKEQFGRVIIEAHACGVPVIGSDSGAIAEVIGDGGVVVPEQNPMALAAAIDDLLGNRPRTSQLGNAGLSQTTRNYTWGSIAAQMARILKATDVISSKKNG